MYLTIAKWVGGALLGLMVAWIVYAGLIRPTTKPPVTTTQKADNIINYNNYPRISFGCARFNVYEKKLEDKIISDPDSIDSRSNPLPNGGK